MSLDLIQKVEEFYFSDDVSRVMPGKKDFKSVKINGKREHKQVFFPLFFNENKTYQCLNE